MISSIELQVISKLLTSDNVDEVEELAAFGPEYYGVFTDQIKFILDHKQKYNATPDVFTFKAQFPDTDLVSVSEPQKFLIEKLKKNRQYILLVETFNKLKSLGDDDVSLAWQYLQNQCDTASQLDAVAPLNIVKDADKRAQQVLEFSKQARIPTGFDEIDKLMYGGLSTVEELLLIVARTNSGKAQPLWSHVLTPSGWRQIGDLEIGDVVVGQNNDNGKVLRIFPQGIKEFYRITFDDDTYAECCDDHLWNVLDASRRQRSNPLYGQYLTLTTKEIRSTMNKKYSIDISEPIEFNTSFDIESELNGYVLGSILVSKDVKSITVKTPEKSSKRGRKKGSKIVVADKLTEYGLDGTTLSERFIPKHFLTAPVQVRKDLLAGLADTAGSISSTAKSTWTFSTESEQLALDFVELARSLGIYVKVKNKKHITCRSIFNPFLSPVKAEKYQYDPNATGRGAKRHCKMIKSIELVGKTECRCILLDNESHTYLTNSYNITHNTWVLTKMMESAQKNGFPVLFYSPEMQGAFLGTRFDTWRTHIQNSQLFQGKYNDDYYKYLTELKMEDTDAFILEDRDMPGGEVNVRNLEAIVKRQGIKLLIVDGLSYMSDTRKSDTDYMKYKNICMDLFKLSKEHGCAVVVAMQANRETKDCRDDKGDPYPNLYNVEGSDHPGRICTQAFAIRQIFDKHVLDIRLEKSRNANNQKPIVSYSWDINTGNVQYIPNTVDANSAPTVSTPVAIPAAVTKHIQGPDVELTDDDFDEDVEF